MKKYSSQLLSLMFLISIPVGHLEASIHERMSFFDKLRLFYDEQQRTDRSSRFGYLRRPLWRRSATWKRFHSQATVDQTQVGNKTTRGMSFFEKMRAFYAQQRTPRTSHFSRLSQSLGRKPAVAPQTQRNIVPVRQVQSPSAVQTSTSNEPARGMSFFEKMRAFYAQQRTPRTSHFNHLGQLGQQQSVIQARKAQSVPSGQQPAAASQTRASTSPVQQQQPRGAQPRNQQPAPQAQPVAPQQQVQPAPIPAAPAPRVSAVNHPGQQPVPQAQPVAPQQQAQPAPIPVVPAPRVIQPQLPAANSNHGGEHVSNDEDPFKNVNSVPLLSGVKLLKPSNPPQNVPNNDLPPIEQNSQPGQSSINTTVPPNTEAIGNSITDEQRNKANGSSDQSPVSQANKHNSEEEEDRREDSESESDKENSNTLLQGFRDFKKNRFDLWLQSAMHLDQNPSDQSLKEQEKAKRERLAKALNSFTLDFVNDLKKKSEQKSLEAVAEKIQGILDNSGIELPFGAREYLENFRDRLQKKPEAFEVEAADLLRCPIDKTEEEEEELYDGEDAYPPELNDLYNSVMAPLNDWQDVAKFLYEHPGDDQAKGDEKGTRKRATEALSGVTLNRVNELEQRCGRDPLDRLANEMQNILDDPRNGFQDDVREFLGNFRDRLRKGKGAFERADFLSCPVAVGEEEEANSNQRSASRPATPVRLEKSSALLGPWTPRRDKEAQLPILTVYYFIQDLNVIQKCGKDILGLNKGEKAQFFVGNPEGQKHRETLYNAVLNPKTKTGNTVGDRFLGAMSDDAIARLWNEQRAERAKSDKDKKEWENKKKRQASLTERKAQLRSEYKEAKNSDQDPSDKQLLVWLLKRFASDEMTDAMVSMPTLNQQANKGKARAGSQPQQQPAPTVPVTQVFRLDDEIDQADQSQVAQVQPTAIESGTKSKGTKESKGSQNGSPLSLNDGNEQISSNNGNSSNDKDNQSDTGGHKKHKKHHEQKPEQEGQYNQNTGDSKDLAQDKNAGGNGNIQTNVVPTAENGLNIPENQESQEISKDQDMPDNLTQEQQEQQKALFKGCLYLLPQICDLNYAAVKILNLQKGEPHRLFETTEEGAIQRGNFSSALLDPSSQVISDLRVQTLEALSSDNLSGGSNAKNRKNKRTIKEALGLEDSDSTNGELLNKILMYLGSEQMTSDLQEKAEASNSRQSSSSERNSSNNK